MTGRGFGRALFSSPGGRSPPPLSPRPAGRSEHPPFPPPPAAGPGGAGLLPRRHGLLRASLFLNASCRGNAADARRDSLPGSGPSPPRPSRLCGADQTPSARPPRSPKTPAPRATHSVLRRSFRSSSSSIGSAGSAPRRSPLVPQGVPSIPPFPRLRPQAPAEQAFFPGGMGFSAPLSS